MRFGILGPLEVDDGGRRLDLGRPKERALLALLLVHANSVVSVDKLVDDLWAGQPPDDAAAALQVQVSRLRRVLGGGQHDPRVTVESRKPGYVLHVGPGDLDAERFEVLVNLACEAMGAGSPAQALRPAPSVRRPVRHPVVAGVLGPRGPLPRHAGRHARSPGGRRAVLRRGR